MKSKRDSFVSLLAKKIPPAFTALLLQCAAFLLVYIILSLLGIRVAPYLFALFTGLAAAVLSRIAKLAIWWFFIQLIFAPAIVLMLAFPIPPGFFLAAFIALLAIYWSAYKTQVPLYLSSEKVWVALEEMLPKGTFRFADLGSGLGGVLSHLARVRPDGYFKGIEYAPLPYLISRLRTMALPNCRVVWGSLWDCDLAEFDVVFAYLSPVPMEGLMKKARSEMRPGTLFISSTFAVPDQEPHLSIEVDDLHRSTLLVWRM